MAVARMFNSKIGLSIIELCHFCLNVNACLNGLQLETFRFDSF